MMTISLIFFSGLTSDRNQRAPPGIAKTQRHKDAKKKNQFSFGPYSRLTEPALPRRSTKGTKWDPARAAPATQLDLW